MRWAKGRTILKKKKKIKKKKKKKIHELDI